MADPSWGEPRSKTIEWFDPLAAAQAGRALGGLEHLRAIADGRLPGAPIGAHFGSRLVSVEPGEVVFTCTPDESAYNPIGVVHGGLVCTLLDSVCGCAVQSLLDAGLGYTSLEIKVSYLRPVTSGSGQLRARGRVLRRGRRASFAEGEVHDGQDRLVATATSTCLIVPFS